MVWSGLRAGPSGPLRQPGARNSASRSRPSRTSRKLSNSTPSSSMVVENGGIEPGVLPPMSAWWPRLAT
jgi:hypothetical protein